MQMYNKSVPYSNRMLRARMGGGGRLLDVGGAANPARANALADLFSEVVILDRTRPRLSLRPNVHFLQCRVEDMDPEAGCFEHILMSNVLEHVADPPAALRIAASVLASSGSLHILSPNCESLNRRIGVRLGVLKHIREITSREKAMGHLHAITVAEVKAMISGAGLLLRECEGVFLKPLPTPEMILWPAPRIKAFFDVAAEVPPELCHEVYFRAEACNDPKSDD